ncbi:hypothetical protein ACLOJK_006873 [Asimina triloba]
MVIQVMKMVKEERKNDRIIKICSGEGVHDKKIKAVKVVVEMTCVTQGRKGFGICCLGHLMRLCPSDGLWVRKKTRILIGIWKRLTKMSKW